MTKAKKPSGNSSSDTEPSDHQTSRTAAEIGAELYEKMIGSKQPTKARKETQGHRKLQQYMADLKRNKHFMAKVKKYRKSDKTLSADEQKEADTFEAIVKKYQDLYDEFERAFPDGEVPHWQLGQDIAYEYGLDTELLHEIAFEDIMGRDDKLGEIYDLVEMRDTVDLLYFPQDAWMPPVINYRLLTFLLAHPVSLNIHRFATKRDVLDYINKNWDVIVSYLDTNYSDKEDGRKKPKFRQRKLERETTDFIWEYRNLSIKELKRQLDKAHPNNGLAYYEIGKVISLEKGKRRLRKLV